ncbi:Mediator of RNA polymerase II transcription subunit 17-like [Oopsacas minuta]|uniref:Mediator of RNA polymerase II transcription subunit 17-like n=1 Tax=Oopsacas minuta TaxID=111878 RepID=A0AAV7K6K8_9METZ|nr:Mediator of RNA polymerase II transcription subunit 17-like [Oopsacas minuta]
MKARETLLKSADILLSGANDLKNCLGAKNGSENAFHNCLWSLRENWRLVRTQDCIMGDLTYHSAGARIQEKGRFLVRKTADPSHKGTSGRGVAFCPVTLDIPQELLTRSALFVYLHTEPVRSSPRLDWKQMERDGWYGLRPPPDLPEWQTQLYKAQLTFFHQEVFSQLMIDAYSQQQVRPVYVCDGQLHIQLREDRWLSLHCIQQGDNDDDMSDTNNMEPIPEPIRALYLFVCDALRQLHRHTETVPYPVPAPSQFQTLERRLDGPNAAYVPVSDDSISSSRGKHSIHHSNQLLPHNNFEQTSVLNKLQEAILLTDLLNYIHSTCGTINSELKLCPILVELSLPDELSPSQTIVPLFERYSQTEIVTLELEPKTGTMYNIVPNGTEDNTIIFSVDSQRFPVFLRRCLLRNWTQKIVEFFSQDTNWLLIYLSPLQPCMPLIQLNSTLSFLNNVTARVVNVSLSFPNNFLISSGFENGYFGSDKFPVVRMLDCVGSSFQEKLSTFLDSLT